uniref:Mitochondrial import inner membrane translocase subunit Tim21 n=1 Tax=Calcidiscus leptoporus TaxID=127549 RepID=A0A7S0NXL2_9EUKA
MVRSCLWQARALSCTGRCASVSRLGYCSKASTDSVERGPEAKGSTETQDSAVVSAGPGKETPGALAVQEDDEDNLPPLAFEPGVVGAAQKGVSAIVIAFGAAAFAACAWGVSEALFPSAASDQAIVNEAFSKVSMDGDVAHLLGSPLKAHGAGGDRGRRNAFERWEVDEGGEQLSVMRFYVAGPQGRGLVYVQVPKKRRRGEFRYVIFEHNRKMYHVVDNRAAIQAERAAASMPQPPDPPGSSLAGDAAA